MTILAMKAYRAGSGPRHNLRRRLFIDRYVHDDDEGCVKVDENGTIDVEDRGLILEENNSEGIGHEK